MRPNEIPAWQEGCLPTLSNEQIENEIERLDMTVTAVEALTSRMPAGAIALGEAIAIVDRGRDLVKSLLTVCRAKSSLSLSDTSIAPLRFRIRRLDDRLETGAAQILEAVRHLPESARSVPPFTVWLDACNAPSSSKEINTVSSSIMAPLQNLHGHLLSTMKLHVRTPDGRFSTMSYAQAVATLKSSDDLLLRRSVFSSFNAWLAEHGASFADLLNAMLGFRLLRLTLEKAEAGPYCLFGERLSGEAYRAMQEALDRALPRIRESVTLRAKLLHIERLPVSALLSSAPGENSFFEKTGDIRDMVSFIGESMLPATPLFNDFLHEANGKHWIDLRRQSGRAGNGWCDNLPAHRAIAVFGNHHPNMAGLCNLAHTLGVGFLHRQLHDLSALEKRVPLCVIETAGQLCETMTDRAVLRRSSETPNSPFALWQTLRRTSNMLLLLPMRHRLAMDLMTARQKGIIAVSAINHYSNEAWTHYFADTVDGSDQYVWAWKQHFFRSDVFFYDWQYTFGYLLSQHLAKRFEETGRTAAGADFAGFCRDAACMSCEELIARHLESDICQTDFWSAAVDEALKPLAEARTLIRS